LVAQLKERWARKTFELPDAYPTDASLFEQWRNELGAPLVNLSSPVGSSAPDLNQTVSDAMVAVALGINIGRMLWRRLTAEATELLMELRNVVHPHEARSIDESEDASEVRCGLDV